MGDSSSFICAVRRVGGIVFDQMVGISLGDVRVTGMAGDVDAEEFDQQCLFRPVQCGKCTWVLGKMYTSVGAGVPLEILNKYTVSRCRVLFYTHGQPGRAIPLAESEEIVRQLHPEPDEVARNLQQVMGLLVYLKEEQDGIVRGLRRIAEHCGVEGIEVGEGGGGVEGEGGGALIGGQEDVGKGWKNRMGKLEFEVERLKARVGEVWGLVPSLAPLSPTPLPAHSSPRSPLVGAQTRDKTREIEIIDSESESDRNGYSKSKRICRINYTKDGNNTEGVEDEEEGKEKEKEEELEKDQGDVYSICTPPRTDRQSAEKGSGQGIGYSDGYRGRGRGRGSAVITPKGWPGRGSQPVSGPPRRRKVK